MAKNVNKIHFTKKKINTGKTLKTNHIQFSTPNTPARPFPPLDPDAPYKYLGYHISLTLNWHTHKDAVLEKIDSAIDCLRDSVYLPTQLEEMVRVCIIPLFRYSASLVPWTPAELAVISTKFGVAMKVAWKVNKGCATAPIRLDKVRAGWACPSAQVLYVQELWASYHQFLQHPDELATMTKYETSRLLHTFGCSTLGDLQEEMLLHPRATTFQERLLLHLATMDVWLSPSEAPDPAPELITLASATRFHRSLLHDATVAAKATLAILPRTPGQPSGETTHARKALAKCRSASAQFLLGLRQLGNRNLTLVSQLVGSPSGGLIPLKVVPGGGALDRAAYAALLQQLDTIPQPQRALMYRADQPTIKDFLPIDPQLAPDPRKWNPAVRGPPGRRRKISTNPPGLTHALPSDDPRFAFERLLVCTELSDDGNAVKCRFRQVLPPSTKKL